MFMFLFNVFVIFITVIVAIVTYFKWKFTYWRGKGVTYIEPRFPFGTLENPFRKAWPTALHFQKQYQHFKSLGQKYGGLYMSSTPVLLLVDTEMIKNVMAKNFQHFTDRGAYYNEKHDPLSANLARLGGHKWRTLRTKLTPTFTSGKIKFMFSTLVACGTPLQTAASQLCQKGSPIDIKDLVARFTTDVIGSCAFGFDCNSFTDADSDFRRFGKRIFKPPSTLIAIKRYVTSAYPELCKRLGVVVSDPAVHNFFLNVVKETVNYRRSNDHLQQRNDFMQLAMDLKNSDGIDLTIEEIAAQALVFFVAGFETSSTTMAYALYELSMNQRIQEKARDEIKTVLEKYHGIVSYEAVMEMKYLNYVLDETLRKYPPAPLLSRVCVEDYQVPDTGLVIDKGTHVRISTYSLHHDQEYFPEPEKFDPERFNESNKHNIVPFSYLPFGEGPRICIGLRFGLLQAKVGLVTLLRDFQFFVNGKTQLPITFDLDSLILSVKGGIWLDIKKTV